LPQEGTVSNNNNNTVYLYSAFPELKNALQQTSNNKGDKDSTSI